MIILEKKYWENLPFTNPCCKNCRRMNSVAEEFNLKEETKVQESSDYEAKVSKETDG